jgi:hypothetical protein
MRLNINVVALLLFSLSLDRILKISWSWKGQHSFRLKEASH